MLRLLFTTLFFSLFVSSAYAETLISQDIAQDTVWTKDMSPIILERNKNDVDRGLVNIHLINGAELRIEAGVKIIMGEHTSFRATVHCQRDYFGKCVKDENGKSKYPKVIAEGTSNEPIIVTSMSEYEENATIPGEWEEFEVLTTDNVFKNVHFRYGGSQPGRYFVTFGENAVVEGVKVEKSSSNGAYMMGGVIKNSTISHNAGNGFVCVQNCTIESNVIFDNTGNAIIVGDSREPITITKNALSNNKETGIVVTAHKDVKITNNFIFSQGVKAIDIQSAYNNSLDISSNFFVENEEGIQLLKNFSNLQIHNNNFLKNGYSLTTSEVLEPSLVVPNNWYGIDSGSQNTEGEFYVSEGFDASSYAEEAHDFELEEGTVAADAYKEYLQGRSIDTKIATLKVLRSVISGKENRAGSLIEYTIEFNNIRTKRTNNVALDITIPSDQLLLECSVQSSQALNTYSLEKACKNNNSVHYRNGVLTWKEDYPALQTRYLRFITTLVPGANKTASQPQLRFNGAGTIKNVSYDFGGYASVHATKEVVAEVFEEIPTEDVSQNPTTSFLDTLKARKEARVNVHPKILAKRFQNTQNLSSNRLWQSYPLETRKEAYELIQQYQAEQNAAYAKGTIFTKVTNDLLFFYLAGDDGKDYKLYIGTDQWYELLDFVKSDKRSNTVAVYGDPYVTTDGRVIGIKMTEFK